MKLDEGVASPSKDVSHETPVVGANLVFEKDEDGRPKNPPIGYVHAPGWKEEDPKTFYKDEDGMLYCTCPEQWTWFIFPKLSPTKEPEPKWHKMSPHNQHASHVPEYCKGVCDQWCRHLTKAEMTS